MGKDQKKNNIITLIKGSLTKLSLALFFKRFLFLTIGCIAIYLIYKSIIKYLDFKNDFILANNEYILSNDIIQSCSGIQSDVEALKEYLQDYENDLNESSIKRDFP